MEELIETTEKEIENVFKDWFEQYIDNPKKFEELESYESSIQYAKDTTRTFLSILKELRK